MFYMFCDLPKIHLPIPSSQKYSHILPLEILQIHFLNLFHLELMFVCKVI